MKKDLSKILIDSFNKYLGYNVIEENNFKGNPFWGLSKTEESGTVKLIFCSLEDIETFPIEYIKIIVTSNQMKPDRLIDNVIFISSDELSVSCFSENLLEKANEFQNVLHWIDENKIFRNNFFPTATVILIVINVLIFLISAYMSNSIWEIKDNVLLELGAKYDPYIFNGEFYRLITCAFLHGGIIHVALNMYSLYCLGPLIEEQFGRTKYLIIYFITIITSSLFSVVFSSSAMSVGASGAIFGLLGAAFIFGYKMRDRINKGFMFNIISVIAINIFIGASLPNIDNFAHIGGLLGGIASSYFLFKAE